MKLIKNRLPHLPMSIALASVLWPHRDDPHGALFRLSLNPDMYPGLGLMVDAENHPALQLCTCVHVSYFMSNALMVAAEKRLRARAASARHFPDATFFRNGPAVLHPLPVIHGVLPWLTCLARRLPMSDGTASEGEAWIGWGHLQSIDRANSSSTTKYLPCAFNKI
jgi:hypothetical protein